MRYFILHVVAICAFTIYRYFILLVTFALLRIRYEGLLLKHVTGIKKRRSLRRPSSKVVSRRGIEPL